MRGLNRQDCFGPSEAKISRKQDIDVSVIVGVFNAMPFFEQCLESVANQSHKSLELIVVDDGSTDGSGEFADFLAAQNPDWVTVVHQPNSGGPAEPRNRGLDLAKGRYVFFLDADDYLGPEAIEKLVQIADENDSAVHC